MFTRATKDVEKLLFMDLQVFFGMGEIEICDRNELEMRRTANG